MKAYTVSPISYEYNDEIYHTGNNGESYEPAKGVYLDKGKANAEAKKLEIAYWKTIQPREYGYDLSDILNWEKDDAEEELAKIFGKPKPKANKAAKTREAKMLARRKELENTLAYSLKGAALQGAVNAAIAEEFKQADEPEEEPVASFDLDNDELPLAGASDEQIEKVLELFSLRFYEVLEVPFDASV